MVNYNIRNNIISGESSKLRRDATVKSSGKESCKKGKGGCNNFIVQRNEERKREREREGFTPTRGGVLITRPSLSDGFTIMPVREAREPLTSFYSRR